MSRAFTLRRRLLAMSACLAISSLALPAAAQQARSYAVLSLAIDKLTMVAPQMTTGSHIDRNMRQIVDLLDDSMDIATVQAAELAIKQVQPGAEVELFSTRSAKAYAAAGMDEATEDTPALMAALKPFFSNTQAPYFVLITKHRGDAKFQFHKAIQGIGKLAGAGFYVEDRQDQRIVDANTGENLSGFFAPYALLRFRLIDIAGQKVLRDTTAQMTKVHAGTLDAPSAWNSMSAEDKTKLLQRMINQTVNEGVGKLLAQP